MTEIEIANLALSAIGTRSSIAALDEGSAEAGAVALWLPVTRDELLRLHPWRFARRVAALPLRAAAAGTPENPSGTGPNPEHPWTYCYGWPADALFARTLLGPDAAADEAGLRPPIRWLEGADTDLSGASATVRVILTNQPSARLLYTARVVDPSVWDAGFVMALVGALASRLVGPLSGDKALAAQAAKAGELALDRARMLDANSGLTMIDPMPEQLRVRGYQGSGEGSP